MMDVAEKTKIMSDRVVQSVEVMNASYVDFITEAKSTAAKSMRGRGCTLGHGRGGHRGGALAGEPTLSQVSVAIIPAGQAEQTVLGARVDIESLPGDQFQQEVPPILVVPEQPRVFPTSVVPEVSAEMRQFMESFAASFQKDFELDEVSRGAAGDTGYLSTPGKGRPVSYSDACISEFYSLELGDMSIARYDQRFNELSLYMSFIVHDEEQKKMKFLKGLRPYFIRFLIGSEAITYADVLSKTLALVQNNLDDRKYKDLRSQQRQDPRPDKGKDIQEQFGGSDSKRQRLGFNSSVPELPRGSSLIDHNLVLVVAGAVGIKGMLGRFIPNMLVTRSRCDSSRAPWFLHRGLSFSRFSSGSFRVLRDDSMFRASRMARDSLLRASRVARGSLCRTSRVVRDSSIQ
ncbi:hypothetical protein GIB67_002428, partial [Kingdonia uniflora]